MLPPGWSRLATRPSWTGSAEVSKTMGMVVAAALAARAVGVPPGNNDIDLAVDQIADYCRQPIQLVVRPAVFDRYILSFDIARLAQALAERADGKRYPGC